MKMENEIKPEYASFRKLLLFGAKNTGKTSLADSFDEQKKKVESENNLEIEGKK